MARELPFFSFGNEAKGVIAIGNSARGVLAIGFSVSVGVVSIGMNAVGVVALGLNAAGPVSLAVINGAGIFAWAGVNVLAGVGGSFVNAGVWPALGVALAVLGLAIGQLLYVPRSRPPDEAPGDEGALADLLDVRPGVYRVTATLGRRGRALVLSEGTVRLEASAAAHLPRRLGRRARCDVRVIDAFDEGGTYRDAAHKRRRLVVEAVEPLAPPGGFLHTEADLAWLLARSLQLVSLVAGALCFALR